MAKWLLVVETNSNDPAREVEFNEWYDNIHLPDVLEAPGFIKATRYENLNPSEGKGKFLALYDIEADDIDQAMKGLRETFAKKSGEDRMSPLLEAVSRGAYKQISSRLQ